MDWGAWWNDHADLVTLAAYALCGVLAIVHTLLFKTNSQSATAWIVVILVIPIAGALLYWFFGINRVWNRHLQTREMSWTDHGMIPDPAGIAVTDAQPLQRVGQLVTGAPLTPGHSVELLVNGEAAYERMLQAIAQARSEVLLCTYIFDDDVIGQQFVEALVAARARGARVCVLLDDLGRRTSWPGILRSLRASGLEVACFMPLRLVPPSVSSNLRNHRKILVVDQVVGFAGGMNIGERHLVSSASSRRAADIHFFLTGPVVSALRQVFQADWRASGGAAIAAVGDAPQSRGGDACCRLIADGPDEALDHLALTISGVISAAQRRVVVMTPYFLPDRRLVGVLQSAALRGVDVVILIPERCNWPVVRWALNHTLWDLLSVGVRVLEQPGVFAHSKCLLVDDAYVMIGSANIDARSLRLNFELGIEVVGGSLPAALEQYLEPILAQARSVSRAQIAQRSLPVRLRDASAALFAPYL